MGMASCYLEMKWNLDPKMAGATPSRGHTSAGRGRLEAPGASLGGNHARRVNRARAANRARLLTSNSQDNNN